MSRDPNVNISMSQALRLSGLRIISASHSGFTRLEIVRRPVECRLCNELRWSKTCAGNSLFLLVFSFTALPVLRRSWTVGQVLQGQALFIAQIQGNTQSDICGMYISGVPITILYKV